MSHQVPHILWPRAGLFYQVNRPMASLHDLLKYKQERGFPTSSDQSNQSTVKLPDGARMRTCRIKAACAFADLLQVVCVLGCVKCAEGRMGRRILLVALMGLLCVAGKR